MMDRVPIGAWGSLFVVLFFGWLWFLWWLSNACPVAFWTIELLLLVLTPALWMSWHKLKEEWDRDWRD